MSRYLRACRGFVTKYRFIFFLSFFVCHTPDRKKCSRRSSCFISISKLSRTSPSSDWFRKYFFFYFSLLRKIIRSTEISSLFQLNTFLSYISSINVPLSLVKKMITISLWLFVLIMLATLQIFHWLHYYSKQVISFMVNFYFAMVLFLINDFISINLIISEEGLTLYNVPIICNLKSHIHTYTYVCVITWILKAKMLYLPILYFTIH